MRTLERQQQLNEMERLIAKLNHGYPPERLRMLFVKRTADEQFDRIGRLAMGQHDVDMIPDHILIWAGYEAASGNKYADYNLEDYYGSRK